MPQKRTPTRAGALPFGGRSIPLPGSNPPLPADVEARRVEQRFKNVRASKQRSIRARRAQKRAAQRVAQREAAESKR